MNFIKVSVLVSVLSAVGLQTAQAEEVVASLPTIKMMADAELREEQVTMTPFQEDQDTRKALQRKIMKDERDLQNQGLPSSIDQTINYIPPTVIDMSGLDKYENSAALKAYVLSVASGLQSSDPTSGIFTMLAPLGIDRSSAISAINSNGSLKINIDDKAMQQMFGKNWQQGVPNGALPRN